MKSVGVENPEGQGFGRPLGQDHEQAEDAYQLVQKEVPIDRFGPGFGVARGGSGGGE